MDLLKVAKHGPGENVYGPFSTSVPVPQGARRAGALAAPLLAVEAETDYTAVRTNLLMGIFWTRQNMKKIILIVLGCLFAVVAVLVGLFYIRGPFVGFAGSGTADGSRAVSDGGIKIAGWNGDVDAAEEKAGMSIRDAKLSQEGDSLHATTGPAATYWMNGARPPGTTR